MVRIPAGTRWSCRSCADCCKGHQLGPVEAEVIAGLEARDIGAHWPPAADGWHRGEGDAVYLVQKDGHCVFLRDDGLCAVHALFGADAKPGFCREFPYHLVEDPKGLVAVIRAECGGFHESFEDGEVIGPEQVAGIEALPRVVPRRRFAPEAVLVLPGRRVDLDSWMILEEEVLERLAEAALAEGAGVALVREHLARRMGAELPPPRAEQQHAAVRAILMALTQVCAMAVRQGGGTPQQQAFFEDAGRRIQVALQAEPSESTGDALRWRHLLLRSFVLSKQFSAVGEVPAGLGLFLLDGHVARANAAGPDAGALSAALTPWKRFRAIPLVQQVLLRARPALVDLFVHAG